MEDDHHVVFGIVNVALDTRVSHSLGHSHSGERILGNDELLILVLTPAAAMGKECGGVLALGKRGEREKARKD